MTAELTLGVEEELHLIDLEQLATSRHGPLSCCPRLPAAQLLRGDPADHGRDQHRRRRLPRRPAPGSAAAAPGPGRGGRRRTASAIAAVGTAPRPTFADFELTTTGRYGRMQDEYRLLVDEQLICGPQVHVGVPDRDLAVQSPSGSPRDLPILLALSASSPFWNGEDTGYASIRTIIWQRWPTAGATGP